MPFLDRFIRSPHLSSQWYRVNGLRLHVRTHQRRGQRPAVLLVHGQVVSSRYMEPLAEHLAPYVDVYVPDLPGFGLSDHPTKVLRADELAEVLAAWLDSIQLKPALCFGNSFGCQILAELAVRHPHHVARLVLQGPTIDRWHRSALQQIGRWLRDGPNERPDLVPILLLDLAAAGFKRFVRTFHHVLRHRIETLLPLVMVPTLVVRGDRDPLVPQRWADELTALLPRGQHVVIEGGHTLNHSHPRELTELLLSFLARTGITPDGAGSTTHAT